MTHIAHIALILDALLLAFAFGATVWFFFIQSPVLLRMWGKEKFIPVQMRLTKTLFAALSVVIPLMLALSFVHGHDQLWTHVLTAGVAMFAALVNAFVVVPRALRAGGKALREVRASTDEDRSVTDFASRGGGEASKVWHRLVVVFVVVMLGGLVAHGRVLMVAPNGADAHHHGAVEAKHEPGRHAADEATRRNVHALHDVVKGALHNPSADEVPGAVRSAFQRIFEQCEMTGAAHESLHHYLIPLAELVEKVEGAEPEARGPFLQAMDRDLEMFDQKFD